MRAHEPSYAERAWAAETKATRQPTAATQVKSVFIACSKLSSTHGESELATAVQLAWHKREGDHRIAYHRLSALAPIWPAGAASASKSRQSAPNLCERDGEVTGRYFLPRSRCPC